MERFFYLFIAETIIFCIKLWCNGIFERIIFSRGYPTKSENYGQSRGLGGMTSTPWNGGDHLAQRHTKECKLLKSTLKPFARSFFTLKFPSGDSFLKKWWKSSLKTLILLTILLILSANEVDVFVFSHNIKAKSLL